MRKYSVAIVGLGLMVLALLSIAVVNAWAQDFKAILANPERPANERALDVVRKPEEMLKFYGVKPGDKVADLVSSRGYYRPSSRRWSVRKASFIPRIPPSGTKRGSVSKILST